MIKLQLFQKFGMFFPNIRLVLISGECITVDEQLLGYRGKVPDRNYMPLQSRKYGLKNFWACKPSTGCALNAIAYGGKEGNFVAESAAILVRNRNRRVH